MRHAWVAAIVALGVVAHAARGDDPAAVLRDEKATSAQREEAAQRLLGGDQAARDQVLEELKAGDTAASASLLQAIARTPSAPRWLEHALIECLDAAPAARLGQVSAALAPLRSRRAAQALLERARREETPQAREVIFEALARLSGRDDLPAELDAWEAWLKAVRAMSAQEWDAALAQALAARADRAEEQRKQYAAKMLDALRRLHLATPPAQRSTLLAGMLSDPLEDVNQLGMELVARELAATNTLGPEVGRSALALLRHIRPRVRQGAALLINQLVPEGAGEEVAAALERESEERAAAAIMLAACRWPGERLLDPVLTWLTSGTPARDAAVEACWALYRAGWLYRPINRELVLTQLRQTPFEHLTAAGCQLLAALGEASDRDALLPLLIKGTPEIRVACAEGLVRGEAYLDAILEAARSDAQLIDAAVRGVMWHRPSAGGLAPLVALSRLWPEQGREGVVAAGAVLPADELFAVCRDLPEGDPLLEPLLGLFASPERVMSEGIDEAKRGMIARALLRLAQLRLARGQAAEALAALDTLPDLEQRLGSQAPDLKAVRLGALVFLDRLDQARELGAPASLWLAALERSAGLGHAPKVAALIEQLFSAALSEPERRRLAELKASLAAAQPAVSPAAPAGNGRGESGPL